MAHDRLKLYSNAKPENVSLNSLKYTSDTLSIWFIIFLVSATTIQPLN